MRIKGEDLEHQRVTLERHNAVIKAGLSANPAILAKVTAAALRAMGERCAELGRPNPVLAEWIAELDADSAA